MKLKVLFLAMIICHSLLGQSLRSRYTDSDTSIITLHFENQEENSLVLSHSVDGFDTIVPFKDYTFKTLPGQYHTIAVVGENTSKYFFFVSGTTGVEFEVILDLADPDAFRIYWDEESLQYFAHRMNQKEILEGYE